jgi:hypothetical protein
MPGFRSSGLRSTACWIWCRARSAGTYGPVNRWAVLPTSGRTMPAFSTWNGLPLRSRAISAVFEVRSRASATAVPSCSGRPRRTTRAAHGSSRPASRRRGRCCPKARAKASVSALSRAEKLRQQGVQSVALMEKAQADRDVNSLDAEAASARLEGLRIELDAAMRGTFLGDSYNDVPYSSQRTQELELRAAELRGCEFLPVAVWAEI